ncbi:MocR-like pyridoxine biosynthesis transcription factor PdxR [Serratia aquatilis]|uniref:PLP-dependent aminotransferase family protein n=1 Tax=Serratia aquatilis TaxID=1737515 RepID=A0ABV6EC78_9GAMM
MNRLTEHQLRYLLLQKELTKQVSPEVSLATALAGAFKTMIQQGELVAGQCLPASRVLAASMLLSRGTIESCYSSLEAEGYVSREVGRGSFISQRQQPLLGLMSEREVRSSGRVTLSRRSSQHAKSEPNNVFQYRAFSPGTPETRNFPIHTWVDLYQQTIKEEGLYATNGNNLQGNIHLREAICDYLLSERGVKAQANQLLIVSSTQQSLSLCAQVLADADDSIFIENPGYPGAIRAFLAAQLKLVPIAVDDQGICVDEIIRSQANARFLYVTPSNQYPTGYALSLERRLALIEAARNREMWIIEDDYDSEFHYKGIATASLQGLDPYQRTIYLGTFSKTLFPDLHVSYMVLPLSLINPMIAARANTDSQTSGITQRTLAKFIMQGHYREHVLTMKKIYSFRAELIINEIKKQCSSKVQVIKPNCGLQILCLVESKKIEQYVTHRAEQYNLTLKGLSEFCTQEIALSGWLMGFAALDPMEIANNIKAFSHLLTLCLDEMDSSASCQ